MMTKTDYEVIANAVASTGMGDSTRAELVENLADMLSLRNPRFKRAKFRLDCFSYHRPDVSNTAHVFVK